MPIDPTKQLITLIYEYLYNRGCKLEAEYHQCLDTHYKNMFFRHPEKHITTFELIELVQKKAQYEYFQTVQRDLQLILKYYEINSSDDTQYR